MSVKKPLLFSLLLPTTLLFLICLTLRRPHAAPHRPADDSDLGTNRQVSERGAFLQNDPEVVAGPGGTLYAVWEDKRTGQWDIYFARSADGGVTWHDNVRVNDAGTGTDHLAPRLAVVTGTLYVSWYDDRNDVWDVYAAYSTDNGDTWGDDVQINDTSGAFRSLHGEMNFDIVACDDDVYVAWLYDEYVFLDHSGDRGQVWDGDIAIPQTQAELPYGVSLARDDACTLYLVWSAKPGSNRNLFLSSSADGGMTWSSLDAISSGGDDTAPSLVTWGEGQLALAWEDDDANQVRAQRSTDGGDSWSVDRALGNTGERQLHVELAADGTGHVHAVWDDGYGPGYNVYNVHSSDGGLTWGTASMLNVEGDAAEYSWPSVTYSGTTHLVTLWIGDLSAFHNVYASLSDDYGATWDNQYRLADLSADVEQRAPSLAIALDGSASHIAWQGTTTGGDDVYVNASTDGWQTHSADEQANDSTIDIDTPTLALDRDGTRYAAWRADNDIYFAYDDDSGWSSETLVNDDGIDTHQYYPSLATGSAQHVCLAWTDWRNGDSDIYASCSTFGGQYWFVDNINVIDEPGAAHQIKPDVAMQGDDFVVIAWEDAREGDDEIYVGYSVNGGAAWVTNTAVTDSGSAYRPTLAIADDGTLHLAWEDRRDGDKDIYYASSPDNGAHWSTPAQVNSEAGNEDQTTPSIATDGTEQVCVAWEDARSDTGDVYFACSVDVGQTWGPSQRANNDVGNAVQTLPSLALDQTGRLHLAWQDDRRGYDNIFFAWPRVAEPRVSSALNFSTTRLRLDQDVIAGFTVHNDGTQTYTFPSLYVQATHRTGQVFDFPADEDVTLAPGECYTYQQARAFLQSGHYTASAGFFDSLWHTLPVTAGATNQVTFSVHPASPALASPADGAVVNQMTPTFSWVAGAGNPVGYHVQIDTSDPVTVTLTSDTPASPLAEGTHTWRVRAYDARGMRSNWTAARRIDVDVTPPSTPTLMSPTNGATVGDPPALAWTASTGAPAGYNVQIDDGALISTMALAYTPPYTLGLGMHSWRVRAYDVAGNYSKWATPFTCTLTDTLPGTPIRQTPADGATLNDDRPVFDWLDSTGPVSGYHLRIDGATLFIVTASIYTPTVPLSEGVHIWDVRARDGNGYTSDWSRPAWTFSLDVTPPPTPQLISPPNASVMCQTHTTLDWNATASDALYHVRIDGGTWLTLTQTYSRTGALSNGAHTWSVRSCDDVGNCSDWQTGTFDVNSPCLFGSVNWGPNRPVGQDSAFAQDVSDTEIGPDGTVYIVWEDWRAGSQDIYFARSEDDGVTWTGHRRVHDASLAQQWEPDLAVGEDGTLYIAWIDETDVGADFNVATSSDAGATWGAPVRINDQPDSVRAPATGSRRPSIGIFVRDGRIYALWSAHVSDDMVYFDYSEDGGLTWHTDQDVRQYPSDSNTQSVSIAVDDVGHVYTTWADPHDDPDDLLYFSRGVYSSTQSAFVWTEPQTISHGLDDQYWPDLGAWGDGQLSVVWSTYGSSDLAYTSNSTDGGDTWRTPTLLDPRGNSQEQTDLFAVGDGVVYGVLSDNARDDDVYLEISGNGGQSWLTTTHPVNPTGEAAPRAWPDVSANALGDLFVSWVGDQARDAVYVSRSKDGGATFPLTTRVSDRPPGREHQHSALALTPDGTHAYAVFQGTDVDGAIDLYAASSVDGGHTWTASAPVTDNDGAGQPDTPDLAPGATGHLYAVWVDDRRGTNDIWFAASPDGGASWTENVRLNTNTTTYNQNAPAIASGAGDDLCVAWQGRYTQSYADIYVRCSSDGGLNWDAEQNIVDAGGTYARYRPTLAIREQHVYVAWEDPRLTNKHIFVAHSPDLGQSWSANVHADDSSGYGLTPSLAVDDAGRVCVAWQDSEMGNGDVFVACSTDDSATWSSGTNVIQEPGTATQEHPRLAWDAFTGRWHVTWDDMRNTDEGGDVYYSYSEDDGATWQANARVIDETTTARQALSDLTIAGHGRAFALWDDERRGYRNVYYAQSLAPDPRLSVSLRIDPANPQPDQPVNAQFTVHNYGQYPIILPTLYVRVTDPLGDVINWPVATDVSLSPREEYAFQQTHAFSRKGGYTAEAGFFDGTWHTLPVTAQVSNRLFFSVAETPPDLLTPVGYTRDTRPIFDWTDLAKAERYTLRIDAGPDITLTHSVYTPTTPLAEGSHTWRVRAYDGSGYTSWATAVFTMDLGAPSTPLPLAPPSGTYVCDATPAFDWSDSIDDYALAGYQFQLDGQAPVTTTTSAYTPTAALSEGGHTWRAWAFDAAGNVSNWAVGTLTVVLSAPQVPTPTLPHDGDNVNDTTPALQWTPGAGSNSGYNMRLNSTYTTSVPYYVPATPLAEGPYTWTVRAFNVCGDYSAWSAPRTFTVVQPSQAWTLMYYFGTDNNQITASHTAVNRLEAAAANPHLQILVLWDQEGSGDTHVYHLSPDGAPDAVTSPPITVAWNPDGELNMGDPQTLQAFAIWARDNYPAEHYQLAIFDHGGGWSPTLPTTMTTASRWGLGGTGMAWDYTEEDYLSTLEVSQALDTVTSGGSEKLDVLYYDACLMGMLENIYAVKDYARYLVASQNAMWNTFPYAAYLPDLDAETTPQALAEAMVDAYASSMTADKAWTIAAFDLAQADTLTLLVDDLAQELLADIGNEDARQKIGSVYTLTQKLDYDGDSSIEADRDGYVDLYHWTVNIVGLPGMSPGATNAAQAVKSFLDTSPFIVAQRHSSHPDLSNVHGLSIYAPFGEELYVGQGCPSDTAVDICSVSPSTDCIKVRDYYTQLTLADDTHWDELVNGLIQQHYCAGITRTAQASLASRPAITPTLPVVRHVHILSTPRVGNLSNFMRHVYLPVVMNKSL